MEISPDSFNDTIKAILKTKKDKPCVVDVPALQFLMIDGVGSPDDPAFTDAIAALFGMSYTIKFGLKKLGIGPDYSVAPLEGLYAIGHAGRFQLADREHLGWTLMIAQPPHVTKEIVETARTGAAVKGPSPALASVRLESFAEGLAVQALHIGRYAHEDETVALMDAVIAREGFVKRGKHHEIYLSDPRRTAPEKIKTVLRQPVDRTA
jgi:hypothetical protein